MSKPVFTQDWFSLSEELLASYLEPYKGQDNINFLEIGSFEGRSSIWFLNNILTGKNCKLYCIDTFDGSMEYADMDVNVEGLEQRFDRNLEDYVGRYRKIKGKSQDVLRSREFDNRMHVAYVDGSHQAKDVLQDVCLAYHTVKHRGLIICDDYMWKVNSYPIQATPKIAIDAFMSCFRDDIKVFQIKWKTAIFFKK